VIIGNYPPRRQSPRTWIQQEPGEFTDSKAPPLPRHRWIVTNKFSNRSPLQPPGGGCSIAQPHPLMRALRILIQRKPFDPLAGLPALGSADRNGRERHSFPRFEQLFRSSGILSGYGVPLMVSTLTTPRLLSSCYSLFISVVAATIWTSLNPEARRMAFSISRQRAGLSRNAWRAFSRPCASRSSL